MSFTIQQLQSVLGEIQGSQHDSGYQIQLLNNYQKLLDTVTKENNIIKSTYVNGVTVNSADGQQSKYVYQSSNILNTINFYGVWIYLVLAVILCAVIFIRQPFSIYLKIPLFIIILTYPYYIYPLEEWSYIISVYVWDVLLSVVYSNGYGNTSLEYGVSGITAIDPNAAPVETTPSAQQIQARTRAQAQAQSQGQTEGQGEGQGLLDGKDSIDTTPEETSIPAVPEFEFTAPDST
jgi:hypothetical protein